jgi:hypothetical protein
MGERSDENPTVLLLRSPMFAASEGVKWVLGAGRVVKR